MNHYENMVVFGDLHAMRKEPWKSAFLEFIAWVKEQPWNNSKTLMLFLGDIVHKYDAEGEVKEMINYFFNFVLKGDSVILRGNHDVYRFDSFLDMLKPFAPKIKVIDRPKELQIDGINFLFLPHYYVGTIPGIKGMKEYYENLPEHLCKEYDFIAAHFGDETQPFGGIDITKNKGLKGRRLYGHIHTTKSSNHIETPIIEGYEERGKDSYLLHINLSTKEEIKLPVPKFLDFYELEYGQEPFKVDSYTSVWTINNAPSKDSARRKYKDLYIRKINLSVKETETTKGRIPELKRQSVIEYLKDFITNNKVDVEVSNKLIEIMTATEKKSEVATL